MKDGGGGDMADLFSVHICGVWEQSPVHLEVDVNSFARGDYTVREGPST